MFVLKSNYDALRRAYAAETATAVVTENRVTELLEINDALAKAANSYRARAEKAEGELAKRKAHALRNLRQNQRPKFVTDAGGNIVA